MSRLFEEALKKADAGEIKLTVEAREALLEGIEVAIGRPDWYRPGDRIALPDDGDGE